ncbi:MAG: hypothetical protein H6Q17_1719 [Bacteroidetes bacterium]|nr:hypothetical protein [Bacteroidota bacterium]
MKHINIFLFTLILSCLPLCSQAQKMKTATVGKNQTEWIVHTFLDKNDSVKVLGSPQVISSKYGKAVLFDGLKDGIFINQMPLAGLEQFTVEAIFRPDDGGKFEQRFFHCGEIKGSRVMLELRSTPKGWYFDAFLNANNSKKTLVDSTLLHPSNQWYHVAFVIDRGKLTTYVNGKKELHDSIPMTPFFTGKTALGVRQNELSWFKGAIYKIKITPKALTPKFFTRK